MKMEVTMDNQELISQIHALIKEQTAAISTYIDQRIDKTESRINLTIENEVSKKIETLFDSYKLAHEKQWEQERKIEKMETEIEAFRLKLLALESKTA
jgi:hypothetical protein